MTTVAEDAEKAKADALKARNADMEKREKELNVGKTGKGTRTFLGMTRGRNPQDFFRRAACRKKDRLELDRNNRAERPA